jgi:hypothetical protein
VHSLSVNERDEPDRTKKQSADEVRAAEDWHADFRATFRPSFVELQPRRSAAAAASTRTADRAGASSARNLKIDRARVAVPASAPATSTEGTTWLRNFLRQRVRNC